MEGGQAVFRGYEAMGDVARSLLTGPAAEGKGIAGPPKAACTETWQASEQAAACAVRLSAESVLHLKC